MTVGWRFLVVIVAGTIGLSFAVTSCSSRSAGQPRVVVVGFDGMDPQLCERLMNEGRMPNLARMRDAGGFKPLGTSIPPQSPVAWSNFITGADPGVHGIFDFIHRDPTQQYAPKYSAAGTVEGDRGWEIDKHQLPLTFWPFNHAPTATRLQRHGIPFWNHLDARGIPTKIYDIPSNYPPSKSEHGHMCCLSGMGVPDLLGGYGTYQYFSSDTLRPSDDEGGMRRAIFFKEGVAAINLAGPDNTLLKRPVRAEVRVELRRHETKPEVRIDWQGQTVLLKEGEWSDWCKLDYELEMPAFLPNAHVSGICRFYVQQVRPEFKLYVTPINIDPSDPGEQRISEPPEFVSEISDDLGLFYTAGFQEDHKARSNKVFEDEEYLSQARYVLKERRQLLDYALDNYTEGLLFFYFSSTDLQAHIFWWDGDDPHPLRTPEQAGRYNKVIEDLYVEMDQIVGEVQARVGDATLLVVSDHGFANFRRQFNLNTWLRDNGYIEPPTCRGLLNPGRGRAVDWSRTKAYGLGLNGLYVNLKGRERDGIVDPSERDVLLKEITEKLLAVRDPLNDEPIIGRVYRAEEVYSGPYVADAPDLIVGYHRDYRASWATTLGDMPDEILTNNDSAWSADHCMAADEVPGVLFTSRPIAVSNPSLIDVAPSILALFNVSAPAEMTGRNFFGGK
jgi:predicted AlkP superfamily phosphohydrolase/phosphomutase